MEQGTTRAGRLTHVAPQQILAHERIYAVCFALTYFGLWSLPFWGPVLFPTFLVYIVLLYDIYWTAQALYSSAAALVSYRRMQAWTKVNWRARYDQTGQTVQQLVVVPNFKERTETLVATLERLAQSDYPSDQLSVVLAMEEREEGALAKAESLKAQFAQNFAHLWITVHPLLSDETAWKGANLSYALRQVKRQCEDLGWNLSRVVITTVDADTRLHPQYLAALAVQFLNVQQPTRKFFQGVLVLMNNVWELHAPIRALSAFWTFTYVTGATHYQRMTTAVYSMSLRLLDEVGYWDPRVLVEDGHIFFRAFFALRGKVEIVPLYMPVGLDAVHAPSFWETIRIQYKQTSRWAWTVANLPFIADQWSQHPEIPIWDKLRKCLPYVEGLLIIPASWFVITFGVLVPPLINPAVQTTAFGIPLSVLAPLILSPSVIGVVVALAINIRLRRQYAKRARPVSRLYEIIQIAEWLLLLVNAVFYFGVPYIQAYWRLLSGKDLHYEPTPK
ncbi:MAG: glycosyltransferase family 2 protein [Chloroflexi bacterium]|nr:MAG: glycosyltransferase family 2 protein [Chloroflexota bacterium]